MFPIQNLINAVTIGFGIGVNAVIAYHLGANELERADRAASQGLTLSLIHGLVLATGCIFLMPRFLPLYSDSRGRRRSGRALCHGGFRLRAGHFLWHVL